MAPSLQVFFSEGGTEMAIWLAIVALAFVLLVTIKMLRIRHVIVYGYHQALENRAGISAKWRELASGKASALGLKLVSAGVKDVMLSGDMKRAYAQVIKAQKEGQAALERARGETAALRNLANAAHTMDENPNLLQLRALQALADSSGNTLVLGLQSVAIPLAKGNGKPQQAPRKRGREEE